MCLKGAVPKQTRHGQHRLPLAPALLANLVFLWWSDRGTALQALPKGSPLQQPLRISGQQGALLFLAALIGWTVLASPLQSPDEASRL